MGNFRVSEERTAWLARHVKRMLKHCTGPEFFGLKVRSVLEKILAFEERLDGKTGQQLLITHTWKWRTPKKVQRVKRYMYLGVLSGTTLSYDYHEEKFLIPIRRGVFSESRKVGETNWGNPIILPEWFLTDTCTTIISVGNKEVATHLWQATSKEEKKYHWLAQMMTQSKVI
jgi:hypothetical protein